MKERMTSMLRVFVVGGIFFGCMIVAGSIGYYGAPRFSATVTVSEDENGNEEFHYDDVTEVQPPHVGASVVNASTLDEESAQMVESPKINPYTGMPEVDYSSRGEPLYVPQGVGSVRPFMAWQLITDETTKQFQLRMEAEAYDENDFGVIAGRYAVAVKPFYGKIGDYIDVIQADDSVIHCIIADYKGDENAHVDGDNSKYYHSHKDVIEFIVNQYSWYGNDQRTVYQYHPDWKQDIKAIYNVGNYWGE